MVDLKVRADQIANDLNKMRQVIEQSIEDLFAEKQECFEEYQSAVALGDARENAMLENAIAHIHSVNAKISSYQKQLAQFREIEDVSNYNSVGFIVPYSTVRLEVNGQEMIYRIYPDDVSFVDIGVIAGNSRLAIALMDKSAGDVVEVENTSQARAMISYKILEVY